MFDKEGRAGALMGALARRGVALVTAAALALGLVPLPAFAQGGLEAGGFAQGARAAEGVRALSEETPEIRIIAPDDNGTHRQNKTFALGSTSSERLVLEVSGTDASADSATWELERDGVVELSSNKGSSVTVRPGDTEGYTRLRATLVVGGKKVTDACVYSAYTPFTPAPDATVTAAAPLTRGPEPGNEERWTRGMASAGQHLTVAGICGDKLRVSVDEGFEFSDGADSSAKVYISKDKVRVGVSAVTLSGAPASLPAGASAKLSAEAYPSCAADKTVSWSSSDPMVASVDKKGKVTALKPGTATIKATAGGKSASAAVRVCAVGMSLSRSGSFLLPTGASERLSASIECEAPIADKSVKWTSSKPKVATVAADGTVKGVSAGQAVVTATGPYGAKASVKVKVKAQRPDNSASNSKKKVKEKPQKKTKPWTSGKASKHVVVGWKQVTFKSKRDGKIYCASEYRVQVKHKGKWRTVKTVGYATLSKKITKFKVGKKWVKLKPGKKYQVQTSALYSNGKVIPKSTNRVTVKTLTKKEQKKRLRKESIRKALTAKYGDAIIVGTKAEMSKKVATQGFTMFGDTQEVSPFAKYYLAGDTLYLHVWAKFSGDKLKKMKSKVEKALKKGYDGTVYGTKKNFGNVTFKTKLVLHESNSAWDSDSKHDAKHKQRFVYIQCGSGKVCDDELEDDRSHAVCSRGKYFGGRNAYELNLLDGEVEVSSDGVVKTLKKPRIHLSSAKHVAHELGHCLGLDDAYTEFGTENSPLYGVKRKETNDAYVRETDDCHLMGDEEWFCYANDWEMALKAYRDAVINKQKGSFQAFTEYSYTDKKQGDIWHSVRSEAIVTPKGK